MTKVNGLLNVKDLSINYQTRSGTIHAVDHISFNVHEGEILGIVGESGSGKSTIGLGLIGLLPKPAGRVVSGEIFFKGKDILKLQSVELQAIRGCEISMTFQDPMTYLNPVMRVGDQIVESILLHQSCSKEVAIQKSLDWVTNVLISDPDRICQAYPHQLSGGMRQRILIAIALSCQPSLIIADEPTTALDVTIQREIIDLLISIRDRFGTAILLITHDLGVVAELCDQVCVVYAGQIFEYANINQLTQNPQNPYTQALLRSARSIDEFHPKLYSIRGQAPSLLSVDTGCRFRERCPQVFERCIAEPPLFQVNENRYSKCWLHANKGVVASC